MPSWTAPVIQAFREKGSLSAYELGQILGCFGPDAVSRMRSAGFVLKIGGKIPNPDPRRTAGHKGRRNLVNAYQLVSAPGVVPRRCPHECAHCREIEGRQAKEGN